VPAANNETNGQKLVDQARKLLTGYPDFYIPPNWSNNNYSNIKSSDGSVSWSPTVLNNRTSPDNGTNETGDHYASKLNAATVTGQYLWTQYLCGCATGDYSKGFPFPSVTDPYWDYFCNSDLSCTECSSGFVCYAFVYAAAVSTNSYNLPNDFTSGDAFGTLQNYTHITQAERQEGDLVLYNYAGSGYQHVAIISLVNTDNYGIKHDKVISAFGYDETIISDSFHYNAKETFLNDFRSHGSDQNDPNCGLFTSTNQQGHWDPAWDSWTVNSNLLIVRLQ